MKNYIYIIVIFFVFGSCAVTSSNKECEENKILYEIINLHFKDRQAKATIYYKAYGQDWSHYLERGVLINRINEEKYKNISEIKDSLFLNPGLTETQKDSIGEATEKNIRTSDDFLSQKDIAYLSNQIKNNKRIRWNKRCLKNVTLSKREYITKIPPHLKKYETTSLFKKYITKLSVPVFSEDKRFALILVNTTDSASLYFYKKDDDNNWKFYGSALLFIS